MSNLHGGAAGESASSSTLGGESGTAAVQRARSQPDVPATSLAALPKHCPECGGRYPADFRVCPRDAVPLEDAPECDDPMLGASLADTYEIVRVIGEGGMGRVYEARHARLPSKRYAIKLLHQELARQPEVVTRFQREAEAVSALVHPNVVSVHDVNHTADGRPYIIAELLEGEELGSFLDRIGKMSPPAAVHVVRHVCRALAAAHARGIVHRDMKPENVFLSGNTSVPSVKVLDFGISKMAESNQNLTKTGVVMGTPAYMAPEQARGDRVDERADIYAVGAILYRAVTGHKPFEGLDPMATLTAVLVDDPPRPCALEPALPPALELVIQRAMAKHPHERYSSMVELESELAPFDPGTLGADADLLRPSVFPSPQTVITGTNPPTLASDSTARTMLARGAEASTGQALASATRTAKLARPALVVHTGLGIAWLLAGLVDTMGAAIRMAANGAAALSTAEVTLTLVGALAALLTPAVLWIRHLRRQVWRSSPRAIETAQRLRRTVLLAAAAYGASALLVHLLESVIRRDAAGIASPGWSVAMFAISASVAAASWFGPDLMRKRQS
jgi:serine/threonine-protein kinase